MGIRKPLRIICHSREAIRIGLKLGWLPGANYNHIRDIRGFKEVGLIDIDWENYDFEKHLYCIKKYRPILTVAKDIVKENEFQQILKQAKILNQFVHKVIIVPKDKKLKEVIEKVIPPEFIIGYSVPSKYGKTDITIDKFGKREMHLLGGRPDIQRQLAQHLNVYSFDCNRITIDAKFGYHFNGNRFIKDGVYGYMNCIEKSIANINSIWVGYRKGGGKWMTEKLS